MTNVRSSRELTETLFSGSPEPCVILQVDLVEAARLNRELGHEPTDALLDQLRRVLEAHAGPGEIFCSWAGFWVLWTADGESYAEQTRHALTTLPAAEGSVAPTGRHQLAGQQIHGVLATGPLDAAARQVDHTLHPPHRPPAGAMWDLRGTDP